MKRTMQGLTVQWRGHTITVAAEDWHLPFVEAYTLTVDGEWIQIGHTQSYSHSPEEAMLSQLYREGIIEQIDDGSMAFVLVAATPFAECSDRRIVGLIEANA